MRAGQASSGVVMGVADHKPAGLYSGCWSGSIKEEESQGQSQVGVAHCGQQKRWCLVFSRPRDGGPNQAAAGPRRVSGRLGRETGQNQGCSTVACRQAGGWESRGWVSKQAAWLRVWVCVTGTPSTTENQVCSELVKCLMGTNAFISPQILLAGWLITPR